MFSFYAYFNKNWIWFVIFSTAMLLTKESGGVLILSILFYELVAFIFYWQKEWWVFIKRVAFIVLPVLIAFIYFLIQKIQYGWFLFPFYMNYISSDWKSWVLNLPSA